MSFVGARPEVRKYFEHYNNEMYATLLLPAGITSDASIYFSDEATLLHEVNDIDTVYIERILPEKMQINLMSINKFSLEKDLATMINTVIIVIKKR